MYKASIPYRLIFIFLLFAFQACNREMENPIPDPEYLIEYELLDRFNYDEITFLLSDYSNLIPFATFLINYDVLVYKIIYETIDPDNNPVMASGALLVPVNKNPMSLLSFQHGTIRNETDAPSNFSANSYFNAILSASSGFITILPDYLGYGISNQMEHPYEHGRSLATASRDMLRAVREFDLSNNEFIANEKLFLTGYSEGGYATMALLKLLEEQHSDEFTVTAATVGAGAYNKSEFARIIMDADEELTHLNSFLWVLDTYNRVYRIDRPDTYYFNEPYAGIIGNGGVFANHQLNPQELFTNTFREAILNSTDTEFISALADNDNFDWKPNTPIQLYHGTDDNFVFYFNSASAYEAMNNRGATAELISVQGGDHSGTATDYFAGTYFFFGKF